MRHYSPDIESFLFDGNITRQEINLEKAVLIDFGGQFVDLKQKVCEYADLSAEGDFFEAVSKVYETLRWAETKTHANCVLIINLAKTELNSGGS